MSNVPMSQGKVGPQQVTAGASICVVTQLPSCQTLAVMPPAYFHPPETLMITSTVIVPELFDVGYPLFHTMLPSANAGEASPIRAAIARQIRSRFMVFLLVKNMNRT